MHGTYCVFQLGARVYDVDGNIRSGAVVEDVSAFELSVFGGRVRKVGHLLWTVKIGTTRVVFGMFGDVQLRIYLLEYPGSGGIIIAVRALGKNTRNLQATKFRRQQFTSFSVSTFR